VSAREDILARIGQAHAAAPPAGPAYEDVSRAYRDMPPREPDADPVELLVDRLVDYKALVRRARADEIGSVVADALRERGISRVVVPPGLPGEWLDGCPVEVRRDDPTGSAGLTVDDLDHTGGVVSGCATAIAETGTLILDASPDQGRRVLTLVPDYHLCVVLPDRIERDVPQALARLDPRRPLTFISGPSATSDIELNRVEGVHGPRTLEVIVVDDPAP
jgi:L-lactate dehydrogenase complex protein LldG